ncbi:MAG: hypothetical protein E7411_02035 [Ruminococcaceae bacterium]|nr:hypothetical protein [Oscillospiraceae bacterium]
MKKLFSLILAVSLILSISVTGFSYAIRAPRLEEGESNGVVRTADDIFFEDFTSYAEGSKPTSVIVKDTANDPISIVAYDTPDRKGKNCLYYHDTTGAPSITLSVPKTGKPVTMELRMKFCQTTTAGFGFIMNFKGNGSEAFRLTKFSAENDSLSFVNSGGNNVFNKGADFKNQWFTVKVRIDPVNKETGVILENEKLGSTELDIKRATNVWHDKENNRVMAYSQSWYNEFKGEGVDEIILQAYGSATHGDYYIDYIKLTENVPEFKPIKERQDGAEASTIKDPVERLVPNVCNVMYKGEVKYMVNPVLLINGRALADVKDFAKWYGLALSGDNEAYKLSGNLGVIEFKADAYSYTFNGSAASTDTAPQFKDNCLYVPIKSFANTLGSTVSWQDTPEKCVIIE